MWPFKAVSGFCEDHHGLKLVPGDRLFEQPPAFLQQWGIGDDAETFLSSERATSRRNFHLNRSSTRIQRGFSGSDPGSKWASLGSKAVGSG